MPDSRRPMAGLSLILTAAVAAALVVFIWSGGQLGGTKKIESDADLAQVASPSSAPAESPGRR